MRLGNNLRLAMFVLLSNQILAFTLNLSNGRKGKRKRSGEIRGVFLFDIPKFETTKERKVPAWLEVDAANYKAKVVRMPLREDISYPVNEQLIVELYSR